MYALQDTLTMTQRVLKHSMKSIDTLITVVLMPVVIMLGSVYVYGSAMDVGNTNYVNYVVPGIFILTIISGIAYASYRLHQDISNGIFERFHSMPITKSAILAGHVYTSVLYNFVSLLFVCLVAFLIGFRTNSSLLDLTLAFLMLLVFNFALTWVAMFFALLAKNLETASLFSYLLMIFVFASSAFAPIETMSSGLRNFATYQPFTFVIDGLRDLLINSTISMNVCLGLLFSLLIWAVFQIGAIRVYKKRLR